MRIVNRHDSGTSGKHDRYHYELMSWRGAGLEVLRASQAGAELGRRVSVSRGKGSSRLGNLFARNEISDE